MQILPLFLAEENPPEPVDILKTKGPSFAFNSAEVLYKVKCEELTLSWGQRASWLSGFSITGLEDAADSHLRQSQPDGERPFRGIYLPAFML